MANTTEILDRINESAKDMKNIVRESYDEIIEILNKCRSGKEYLKLSYSMGSVSFEDTYSSPDIVEVLSILTAIILKRGETGIKEFKEFLYTVALPAFVNGWDTYVIPHFIV
jgi:hypothetical protein